MDQSKATKFVWVTYDKAPPKIKSELKRLIGRYEATDPLFELRHLHFLFADNGATRVRHDLSQLEFTGLDPRDALKSLIKLLDEWRGNGIKSYAWHAITRRLSVLHGIDLD